MTLFQAEPRQVIGWDIGGVNTKAALVSGGRVMAADTRPFELQRSPGTLVTLVREVAAGLDAATLTHAVTMTAELSQMFRTKREGVAFVLDAVETALAGRRVLVFTVDGLFLSPADARRDSWAVAASNWAATARQVARHHPDAVLVDIGTTTTDIIPILGGSVVALGRTDPERLASGELVYTGAVRTPVEALASSVPLGGTAAGVSAEAFATSGDVYVWRGDLAPDDYAVPTADGRPPTREYARERLARVVCADREMLDDHAVTAIADALAAAQRRRVAGALARVARRHRSLKTVVVTGVGAFLGASAARDAGLDVVWLSSSLGEAAARCAPAASVALLLERRMSGDVEPGPETGLAARPVRGAPFRHPEWESVLVVKVGGGLLEHPGALDRVVRALDGMRSARVLVVPGGGPFADAVRDADRRFRPGGSAAHWMAILAMDQYAHLLVSRLSRGALVTSPAAAASALDGGSLAVLAPYTWLRAADPLPHTWEVTSDSIAAWVARTLGARRLLLIKPAPVSGAEAVDAWFPRALGPALEVETVAADSDALESRLARTILPGEAAQPDVPAGQPAGVEPRITPRR